MATTRSAAPGDEPVEPVVPPASRRQRVQDWVHRREERLEAARNTSQTVDIAFDALSYDTDTGAPVLAAALAFRVFLFQLPYVCAFVIGAGFFSDITNHDAPSLFHGRGVANLTAKSVSAAADLSGWARFSALIVVLYALFLSARSFVKVLNIVHALVWNVPRRKLARPNRAALVFIGVTTALLSLSIGCALLRERSTLGGLVALVLYTLAPFAAWWFVSWLLPHRDCPLIALAPGAAVVAVGAELLHVASVIWFPHYLESKSEVYGTIGTAAALLLWAYLLGRLVTLAVVLNVALWDRFGAQSAHPLRVPRPKVPVRVVDDKVARVWGALFGTSAPPPPPSPPGQAPDRE